MVVFKQMKDGALTTQSIEALNAMYPMLYTMMKATISQTLSPDHLKTMSYDKRRAIALFLGKPLDSSMIPQVMASNQLVYSQMGAAKAAQGETKTSKTGMEKMNVAGRASTKTERASVPREVQSCRFSISVKPMAATPQLNWDAPWGKHEQKGSVRKANICQSINGHWAYSISDR